PRACSRPRASRHCSSSCRLPRWRSSSRCNGCSRRPWCRRSRSEVKKKGEGDASPLKAFSALDSMLVLDPLPVAHFALVDAQREAALRIGTGPRLEDNGGALLPVIGKRDQHPVVALLALGKIHHPSSSPDHPRPGRVGFAFSTLDKQQHVSKQWAS